MAETSAHEAVTAAALRGDAGTLRAFAESLPPLEAYRYDRRLALAYAAALEGDADGARTHFALAGVAPAAQRNADAAHLEELLAAPVAVPPRPLLERAAVPAVTAASLIAAVVALALLPQLGSDELSDLGLAAPPSSGKVVVIAKQALQIPGSETDTPTPATIGVAAAAIAVPAAALTSRTERLATRPRARAAPTPRPATRPTAPASQPAPAPTPMPESTGVLAAAASPAPVSAAAPAVQQPDARSRGKAVGHAKRTAKPKPPKPTPAATASLPAPDSSLADVPAADHPSPPEHSSGNGRDDAPGQRKTP